MHGCRPMLAALDALGRPRHFLLFDSRQAIGRNDPEYESWFAPHRRDLVRDFPKAAVLVSTSAGRLHSQRLINADSAAERFRVFDDYVLALAFLRTALRASTRPGDSLRPGEATRAGDSSPPARRSTSSFPPPPSRRSVPASVPPGWPAREARSSRELASLELLARSEFGLGSVDSQRPFPDSVRAETRPASQRRWSEPPRRDWQASRVAPDVARGDAEAASSAAASSAAATRAPTRSVAPSSAVPSAAPTSSAGGAPASSAAISSAAISSAAPSEMAASAPAESGEQSVTRRDRSSS